MASWQVYLYLVPVPGIQVHEGRSGRVPGGVAVGPGGAAPVELANVFRAAEHGYLAVLQWAWEHSCPWDENNAVQVRRVNGAPRVGVGAG